MTFTQRHINQSLASMRKQKIRNYPTVHILIRLLRYCAVIDLGMGTYAASERLAMSHFGSPSFAIIPFGYSIPFQFRLINGSDVKEHVFKCNTCVASVSVAKSCLPFSEDESCVINDISPSTATSIVIAARVLCRSINRLPAIHAHIWIWISKPSLVSVHSVHLIRLGNVHCDLGCSVFWIWEIQAGVQYCRLTARRRCLNFH